MRKTKTWHFGETSFFGTWKINLRVNAVIVSGLKYKTNQVMESRDFQASDLDGLIKYLWDNVTSFHATQIIQWVASERAKNQIKTKEKNRHDFEKSF